MIEKRVHERAGVVARRGMHNKTRRFVHHDDMGVLVNYGKRDRFRQDVVDLSFRQIKRDGSPSFTLYPGFSTLPFTSARPLLIRVWIRLRER